MSDFEVTPELLETLERNAGNAAAMHEHIIRETGKIPQIAGQPVYIVVLALVQHIRQLENTIEDYAQQAGYNEG